MPSDPNDRDSTILTIVTPSFEKHAVQYETLVASLAESATDLARVQLLVIVEQKNVPTFTAIAHRHPNVRLEIVTTETILHHFGIEEEPNAFLRRVGKFTFQALKKFGGILSAQTQWSLVLDSETVFHNPFSVADVLQNYLNDPYVFFTDTEPRGPRWSGSLGHRVTQNATEALGLPACTKWFMEYFHWFYDRTLVAELIEQKLGPAWFAMLEGRTSPIDYFENILYYVFLHAHHHAGYRFIDFKGEVTRLCGEVIGARFQLNQRPFAEMGNDFLLSLVRPREVASLGPLFAHYRLPFLRLEPTLVDPEYIEELKKLPNFVASVSSHHLMWLRKKFAVCISGRFPNEVGRTPEQQVRQLKSFLTGVACDIYVHGWSTPDEAFIIETLSPKLSKFEAAMDFSDAAGKIVHHEQKTKPRRDEGSLAMFYSMEQCFGLIADPDAYEYVIRIRPDLYTDRSLKDLLFQISNNGDYLPNAVYVPRMFHSQGINDQFAIGPVSAMRTYCTTYAYALRRIRDLFFNPEHILLTHLLENNVRIAVIDFPYALMRAIPMTLHNVLRLLIKQRLTWWSRTLRLPVLTDVTAFFRGRVGGLLAVHALRGRGQLMKDSTSHQKFLVLPNDSDPLVSARRVGGVGRFIWPRRDRRGAAIAATLELVDKEQFKLTRWYGTGDSVWGEEHLCVSLHQYSLRSPWILSFRLRSILMNLGATGIERALNLAFRRLRRRAV